jgi:hypothetical protein
MASVLLGLNLEVVVQVVVVALDGSKRMDMVVSKYNLLCIHSKKKKKNEDILHLFLVDLHLMMMDLRLTMTFGGNEQERCEKRTPERKKMNKHRRCKESCSFIANGRCKILNQVLLGNKIAVVEASM